MNALRRTLCLFLTPKQTAATAPSMTVRPPRYLSGVRAPDTPQSALDYEIAQEKASTLGRLGRRLEAALAELAPFDARIGDGAPPDCDTRKALLDAAGTALWHFIVQREVLGLRDSARVLHDYRVPDEVRDRTGAFVVPPVGRRRPRR